MTASAIARSLPFLVAAFFATATYAQSHFSDCSFNTGSNATLILPASALYSVNGNGLSVGDEIGVFSSDGICSGAATWTGSSIAVAVWADDQMTSTVDGHLAGDALHIRIWDADSKKEYPSAKDVVEVALSDEKAFYRSENAFASNAIFVLESVVIKDAGAKSPDLQRAVALGSDEAAEAGPAEFSLLTNYPNPFNASTTFAFEVERTSPVTIKVFDTIGREVAVPVSGVWGEGRHEVRWDAGELPTGRYIYRMEIDGQTQARVLSLVK